MSLPDHLPTRRNAGLLQRLAKLFTAGVCTLALCAPPSDAAGFVVSTTSTGAPLHWSVSEIPWYLDAAGSDDIGFEKVKASLTAAFDAWSSPECTSLNFVYMGEATEPQVNAIYVYFEEQIFEYKSNEVLAYAQPMGTMDGTIHQATITFNGVDYTWTDIAVTGDGGLIDMQAVVTHEIGHALGLHHPRDRNATMFFTGGGMVARALAEDDVRGVCYLFPAEPFQKGLPCDSCLESDQCAVGACVAHEWESGNFCGQDCSHNSQCPIGFRCEEAQGQCRPEYDFCRQTGANIPFGEYCWGAETCESGLCFTPDATAFCSELCAGDAECPANAACTQGRCLPNACNPMQDTGCEPGRACLWYQGAPKFPGDDTISGRCVGDQQGANAGEPCGDTVVQCKPNLICVVDEDNPEASAGVCRKDCREGTHEGCTSDERCHNLGESDSPDRGVCKPYTPPPAPDIQESSEDTATRAPSTDAGSNNEPDPSSEDISASEPRANPDNGAPSSTWQSGAYGGPHAPSDGAGCAIKYASPSNTALPGWAILSLLALLTASRRTRKRPGSEARL